MSMVDPDYDGSKLVFLVGSPRSGTTWLQRLLGSHPQIATGQESHLFSEFLGPQLRRWKHYARPSRNRRGGLGPGCYHTEEQFRGILRGYMLALLRPLLDEIPPSGVFLEKTPGHALYMGEIDELLPAARFIHLIRDGRDVAASLLRASASWGSEWAPTNAPRAAILWRRHVQAARRVGQDLPPDRYYEVRYEDLHRDGASTLMGVFAFLGLPVDRTDVEVYLRRNRVDAARRGEGTPIPLRGQFGSKEIEEVREPEGFIHQGHPGSGARELSWIQRLLISYFAGSVMKDLGYLPRSPFSR